MGKLKISRITAWSIAAILLLAGFGLGWSISATFGKQPTPQSLRLSGYQFINPLLACNINNSSIFPQDRPLNSTLTSIINTAKQSGTISKASVYFANFNGGEWANLNPGETYYPSSLGKIPIMIAYYEQAENSSTLLDQRITYTGGPDLNQTQDIKPSRAIVPGQTYTIEQLIEYMIEDSDNNATQLLYNNIDQATLQNVYGNLGIPTNADPTLTNLDFITPQQIGLLFRILRNGTYLSRDYSEKALQLMSQSSFTQGIVAGVPNSTVVAHKLGLVEITGSNGLTTEHELHDCGIIYGKDPYLLCVMTRGSSSLTTMEGLIANISKATYEDVENGD